VKCFVKLCSVKVQWTEQQPVFEDQMDRIKQPVVVHSRHQKHQTIRFLPRHHADARREDRRRRERFPLALESGRVGVTGIALSRFRVVPELRS
jgi:Tat protein secretion system quality control protein TatD with DNase activity